MQNTETTRPFAKDEKGRPIADDGYPVSGLATINELAAIVSLSRSKIYQKINDGSIPSVTFGRSRRVQWPVVRKLFLTPAECV